MSPAEAPDSSTKSPGVTIGVINIFSQSSVLLGFCFHVADVWASSLAGFEAIPFHTTWPTPSSTWMWEPGTGGWANHQICRSKVMPSLEEGHLAVSEENLWAPGPDRKLSPSSVLQDPHFKEVIPGKTEVMTGDVGVISFTLPFPQPTCRQVLSNLPRLGNQSVCFFASHLGQSQHYCLPEGQYSPLYFSSSSPTQHTLYGLRGIFLLRQFKSLHFSD